MQGRIAETKPKPSRVMPLLCIGIKAEAKARADHECVKWNQWRLSEAVSIGGVVLFFKSGVSTRAAQENESNLAFAFVDQKLRRRNIASVARANVAAKAIAASQSSRADLTLAIATFVIFRGAEHYSPCICNRRILESRQAKIVVNRLTFNS